MIPLAFPEGWRRLFPGLIAAAVALALLASAAAAGAVIAGWRWEAKLNSEKAAHQLLVTDLLGQISALKLSIAEQSKATAVLSAKTEAAREAQAAAEQQAAKLAEISKDRIANIERAVKAAGASCGSVLRAYWGQP